MSLDKVLEKEGAKSVAKKEEEQAAPESEEQKEKQLDSQEKEISDIEKKSSKENQNDERQKEEQKEGRQAKEQEAEGEKADTESESKGLSQEDAISFLNKQLEAEFSSIEDIKELMSSKDKVQSYEEQLRQKDEALNSAGNPYANFASDNILKANEIMRNNQDIDESTAMRLATTNFDNLSDDDVLVLKETMDNPYYSGNESMVKQMINKNYGLDIDSDDEELSDKDKQMIEMNQFRKQADAKKAREHLKQISNVETPEKKNIEQQYRERVEKFRPQADEMIDKKLDKIKLGKNEYEFEVSDKFKDFLKQEDRFARILAHNFNPDNPDENYDQAISELKDLYFKHHKDKIVDDLEESIRTRMQDEFDKKTDNPKPNNRQERQGPSDADTRNKEQESKAVKSVRGR